MAIGDTVRKHSYNRLSGAFSVRSARSILPQNDVGTRVSVRTPKGAHFVGESWPSALSKSKPTIARLYIAHHTSAPIVVERVASLWLTFLRHAVFAFSKCLSPPTPRAAAMPPLSTLLLYNRLITAGPRTCWSINARCAAFSRRSHGFAGISDENICSCRMRAPAIASATRRRRWHTPVNIAQVALHSMPAAISPPGTPE